MSGGKADKVIMGFFILEICFKRHFFMFGPSCIFYIGKDFGINNFICFNHVKYIIVKYLRAIFPYIYSV